MCLKNDLAVIEKLNARKSSKIVCYKYLKYRGDCQKLTSPFHKKLLWSPGYVLSDNTMPTYRARHKPLVYHGIHVFKSLDFALKISSAFTHLCYVPVKLEASKSDLLGASDITMAFAKVYLSKEEYEKALRKGKKLYSLLKAAGLVRHEELI